MSTITVVPQRGRAYTGLMAPSGTAMQLDYYGLDQDLTAHDEQIAVVRGPARPALLAAQAWYLRQRDTGRALALADNAQALLAADAMPDAKERGRTQARLSLVRGEALWLLGDPPAAMVLVDNARSGFEVIDDRVGMGDASLVRSGVCISAGDHQARDAARAAAVDAYNCAGDTLRRHLAQTARARADAFADAESAVARWEATFKSARVIGHPGPSACQRRGKIFSRRGLQIQRHEDRQRPNGIAHALPPVGIFRHRYRYLR